MSDWDASAFAAFMHSRVLGSVSFAAEAIRAQTPVPVKKKVKWRAKPKVLRLAECVADAAFTRWFNEVTEERLKLFWLEHARAGNKVGAGFARNSILNHRPIKEGDDLRRIKNCGALSIRLMRVWFAKDASP